LDAIAPHIEKTTPLFLCINNDIVLTKTLENSTTAVHTALVNEAFPNLNIAEFYWDISRNSSKILVSIARKETVQSLLKSLEKFQIFPFQIALCITHFSNLISYIDNEDIVLPTHQFILEENNFFTYSRTVNYKEKEHLINGLKISSDHLLSFSQILGYINNCLIYTNLEKKNKNLSNELKNKRLFKIIGTTALLFFGLLLLANFVFYNFYNTRVYELSIIAEANNSQKSKLATLQEIVNEKEAKVAMITNNMGSNTTYYVDVLGESVPYSILLNSIVYQPLLKKIKHKAPILLKENILTVSGVSRNIEDFSNWINIIENYDWVTKVETHDYDYKTANSSQFSIEIKLRGSHKK